MTYQEFVAMKPVETTWSRWLVVICGEVPEWFSYYLGNDFIESEAAYHAWLSFCEDVDNHVND